MFKVTGLNRSQSAKINESQNGFYYSQITNLLKFTSVTIFLDWLRCTLPDCCFNVFLCFALHAIFPCMCVWHIKKIHLLTSLLIYVVRYYVMLNVTRHFTLHFLKLALVEKDLLT